MSLFGMAGIAEADLGVTWLVMWAGVLLTLAAGGSRMGLRHGTYWRKDDARMSNLFLSILRSLGIEQESFADSTGTLSSSIFGRS